MDDGVALIFLHIPKTAGTSMIELVGRNFAADAICRITNVDRPTAEIASDIEVALAEGRRFICGHFPYAAVSHLHGDVRMFTMLRDPTARIQSLYRFWRTQPDTGGGASAFVCRLARALDFEDFLACEHPLVVAATQDEMCKTLGSRANQRAGRTDAAELYQAARANLGNISFGLVESFDLSMRMLSRALPLNLLDSVHVNRTDHLPAGTTTPLARARLLQGNMADTMLHDFARRQFQAQARDFEMAALFRDIGAAALTPMVPDDRGGLCWDATMPISGVNWNDRETLGHGLAYRFSSSPETLVYLPHPGPGRSFSIAIDAGFFYRDGMVDVGGALANDRCLEFALDGEPVGFYATRLGEAGERFHINVDGETARGPFLTLALRSPYGLSPALFGSPDHRTLVAAITAIRMVPG